MQSSIRHCSIVDNFSKGFSMKKVVLFLLFLGLTTYLNAGGSEKKISAGYNSEGDKVYLTIKSDLIALLSIKGADEKFIAKTWLKNCAPSNIFKGKIVKTKKIDNDMKLYIDYKWKRFGSGSSEMLIIFNSNNTYTVQCVDYDD
jgi:hypothetical protein